MDMLRKTMQGELQNIVKDAEAGYMKILLLAHRKGYVLPVPAIYSSECFRCRELEKQGLLKREEKTVPTYKLTEEGRHIAGQLEIEMAAKA